MTDAPFCPHCGKSLIPTNEVPFRMDLAKAGAKWGLTVDQIAAVVGVDDKALKAVRRSAKRSRKGPKNG